MRRLARALLLALMAGTPAQAADWSFALIGDIPYTPYERRALPLLLEEIHRRSAAFIIHAGDIKWGGVPCTDELFRDRLEVFRASQLPLVFVPGDNEWTDCQRPEAGGYDPQERLERLRALFYPDDRTLGRWSFQVERQSGQPRFAAYREHTRWSRGPVMFVTANVPGSNNNFGPGPEPSDEFVRRSEAVSAWLGSSFEKARGADLKAIVIVMQANPGFESAAAGHPRPAYRALLEQLAAETRRFPGQVVLVHGDTHNQRIDQPLRDPDSRTTLRNFTRVETFGTPFVGWIRVGVDESAATPLRFQPIPFSIGE